MSKLHSYLNEWNMLVMPYFPDVTIILITLSTLSFVDLSAGFAYITISRKGVIFSFGLIQTFPPLSLNVKRAEPKIDAPICYLFLDIPYFLGRWTDHWQQDRFRFDGATRHIDLVCGGFVCTYIRTFKLLSQIYICLTNLLYTFIFWNNSATLHLKLNCKRIVLVVQALD